MLRKFPGRIDFNKAYFVAYLQSLPEETGSRMDVIRMSRLHMATRDEYAGYLQKYRIGVKRDERKMIENVARMVGLSIKWDELSGK